MEVSTLESHRNRSKHGINNKNLGDEKKQERYLQLIMSYRKQQFMIILINLQMACLRNQSKMGLEIFILNMGVNTVWTFK
eukprot:snap_masked-scaffold_56-processed-gene-1.51-mRNA-1 protein AED:1.00 eAED:1.00 QI:0/-1/0/0/-1/1/1/0/79